MGVLMLCLVFRLVAINGDGGVLATFFAGVGLTAFGVGAWLGGRAFCHYVCPVGVVERIYTDASPSIVDDSGDSACTSCSGCVSACADIDQERSFLRSATRADRRRATYAFPGIVFAFYAYYALRGGDWSAYFDGAWTDRAMDAQLLAGAGWAFAPWMPAWAAAGITLVVGAWLSLVLFNAIERLMPSRWDAGRRREVVLALAGFAAFLTFYTFAGAPTLRLVPGATRIVLVVTSAAATVVLVSRLRAARLRRNAEVVVLQPKPIRHLSVVGGGSQ